MRSQARRRANLAPLEYAANGALLSQFEGRCYWCGELYLEGHPIRFVQRRVVHDSPCYPAMRLDP